MSALSSDLLSKNETVVEKMVNGDYMASTLLMGYDSRLGTLVIIYQPEVFHSMPTGTATAVSHQ